MVVKAGYAPKVQYWLGEESEGMEAVLLGMLMFTVFVCFVNLALRSG
jgi:hypothetical protein